MFSAIQTHGGFLRMSPYIFMRKHDFKLDMEMSSVAPRYGCIRTGFLKRDMVMTTLWNNANFLFLRNLIKNGYNLKNFMRNSRDYQVLRRLVQKSRHMFVFMCGKETGDDVLNVAPTKTSSMITLFPSPKVARTLKETCNFCVVPVIV